MERAWDPSINSQIGETLYRSREFLDSLAEGIMLIDLNGIIVDCNETAASLLGTPVSQMIGRQISDPLWGSVNEFGNVIHRSQLPAMITISTGEPVVDTIIGIDMPGDGRRWMSTNSTIISQNEITVGVANTFLDVTHLMAEKRALQTFMRLSTLDLENAGDSSLLTELCRDIIRLGGYAFTWVAIEPDGPESIEILASAGDGSNLNDRVDSTVLTRADFVQSALLERSVHVVPDIENVSGDEPWQAVARTHGFTTAISIPLEVGDGLSAVVTIFGREPGAFNGPAEDLLSRMTAAFSLSLIRFQDARLLDSSFEGTLVALGAMSEIRDPYTKGHQVNVGKLARAMGARLGLKTSLQNLLQKAGEVHDVGKTMVPSEILGKSYKLDPLEYELIKRHALAGGEILSKASLPWPIAEVAVQHHERLDGSGYPYGLKADEICLPAKIVAVADIIDAMAHHRPYRPALGFDAAITEVRKGAGTIFDQAVADSCEAVLASGFEF